jgi:polysaccharide export outer membrane protein
VGVALAMFISGCAGPAVTGYRFEPYRPSTEGLAGIDFKSEANAEGTVESGDADAGSDGASTVVAATEPAVREGSASVRKLGRGDRIIIYLRGIPVPEKIEDIIDGFGECTLPYIGEVQMEGKTTSEVERLIETAYVDGGIYRHINIIVVAEDEMYFVQGEVAKQGKFPLSGPVTLLQAISEAGGYSPFAHRKKIKVIRGDEILYYNAKDIADGELPDPPIKPDDIIEVLRKVI